MDFQTNNCSCSEICIIVYTINDSLFIKYESFKGFAIYYIKREEPACLLNTYYMVSNVLDARNKKSWKSKAHTITGKRQK